MIKITLYWGHIVEKISFAYLLQTVLRYLYLVIAAVLVFSLGAFFYSKYIAVPRYSATGQLLVTNGAIVANSEEYSTSSNKKVLGSDIAASADLKPTIVRALQENALYKKLAGTLTKKSKQEGKNITYSYSQLKGNTKIQSLSEEDLYVDITFTSEDPEEAKWIVNELLALAKPYLVEKMENLSVVPTESDGAVKTYPSTLRNIIISGLLGALIALVPIILFAFFNNTIQTENDLMDNYEIPVIGNIPDFTNAKSGKGYNYNYNYNYYQRGGYGYYGRR